MARIFCFLLCSLISSAVLLGAQRPNIIVILSDDMGYSDIGCYGGEIRTPNLDQMASNGLRFTQFYNTGRCCPSRATLLTGLYAHQAGIGHMMRDDNLPGFKGDLGKECVTIAEVLKPTGYSTYMVGKWHVTPNGKDPDKHNWPLQRGFDRFYGTIHGGGSLWDPNSLTRGNQFVAPDADPEYKPQEFYYTDAISDNAIRYIKEQDKSKPFFMYVAYTAAHWPMHAPDDEIAKYKGVYDKAYKAIRESRRKKMLELGVINKSAKMSQQVGDWSKVQHKEWELRCMETYAAMVTCMDAGIGKIMKSLESTGQLENTLVMFMQDNGGCQEGFGRKVRKGRDFDGKPRAATPPLPPMKPGGLQTDMVPKQSRDGYPVRYGPGAMPGPADTFIGYGINWANVSNTPFRKYKHFVHEGGISTPMIAHWPAGIKVKNQLRRTPSHLIDIMATCVDLSEAKYPKKLNGVDIHTMEGMSLVSVFNKDKLPERHIMFEHEGNAAIRMGRWKLVGQHVMLPDSTNTDKWELYDMENDRSELNNLVASNPERFEQMRKLFESEAERLRMLPSKYGRPKKNKKKKSKR